MAALVASHGAAQINKITDTKGLGAGNMLAFAASCIIPGLGLLMYVAAAGMATNVGTDLTNAGKTNQQNALNTQAAERANAPKPLSATDAADRSYATATTDDERNRAARHISDLVNAKNGKYSVVGSHTAQLAADEEAARLAASAPTKPSAGFSM